jgi:hypothetical protein
MVQVTCAQCGTTLTFDHDRTPCPKCGSLNRALDEVVDEVILVEEKARWESLRLYWERKPMLLTVVAAGTLGSPFIGLALAGWPGVIIGALAGVALFAGGAFALTHVREKESGGA